MKKLLDRLLEDRGPHASPPAFSSVAALVVTAVVVARVGDVGHAGNVVDAVVAVALCAVWARFGSSRSVDVVAAALVLGALCAVPLSRGPWISFLALPVVTGFVAAVAVGAIDDARRAVCAGTGLAGVTHAVVALVQRFVTWPDALAHPSDLPASVIARMESLRPIGLSLSPDLGAAVALAGVVGAVAVAVDEGVDKNGRVVGVVSAVVCAAALVASRSYGVFVCAGAGVVVFAILRRSWKALSLLGVAGVGIAVAASARGLGGLTTSALERWRNWELAWDAFRAAPVVGHGFLRFAPAYLERRTPDANVTRYAHSHVMQWLSETGVVGGVALVVAGVVVVRALFSGPRSLRRDVLCAGACALLARGLIDYDFEVAQTAVFGGLVVGAAFDVDTLRGPRRFSRVAVVALVVGAVVVVGFVVKRVVPGVVRGVDVEVAFAEIAGGAAPDPTLLPFVDEVAPAAVRVAQQRLGNGDVQGALALTKKALARDPGFAPAWALLANLVAEDDVDAVVKDAARWGVVLTPSK